MMLGYMQVQRQLEHCVRSWDQLRQSDTHVMMIAAVAVVGPLVFLSECWEVVTVLAVASASMNLRRRS
jgi:hypothetical protein